MAKEKRFLIVGNYEGRKINIKVNAYSKKQAKLKAGYDYGMGGNMKGFLNSKKVRVVESR